MNVTLGLIFVALLRKEWPMTFIAVRCPHCQSDQIVKRGKTARGTQRYLCQNSLCPKGSFLLDYCNRGCLPEVKQTIIDMSLNASGVRDTARSLHKCLFKINFILITKSLDDPFNILNQGCKIGICPKLDPFILHKAPKDLNKAQLRGIFREIEYP